MNNEEISLFCHFNKIIKVSGTSFQSAALSQNMLEKFVIQHTICTNFIFIVFRIQKK